MRRRPRQDTQARPDLPLFFLLEGYDHYHELNLRRP